MPSTTTEHLPSRFTIAIVTTDQSVPPEAETYLSADYNLRILPSWNELTTLIKKDAPHAVLLDIDVIGEHPDEGVSAFSELRSLVPDLLLLALTRSRSKALRYKAMDATVDASPSPLDPSETNFSCGD